jgi:antitoxin component of RelBE/YafQ-DinJ toxin-antitoxin module
MTIQHHQQKVEKTNECSLDERASKPNKETLQAMKELDDGKGVEYTSMDDFWKNMGVKPGAKS